MDYKELVEQLEEWNENLISELCADDILNCDDLCGCTRDCIVVQAAAAIIDLLARAEAAEARAEKAERERDAAIKCIDEIEDALNFKRMSAIGLRISEYCGQKED